MPEDEAVPGKVYTPWERTSVRIFLVVGIVFLIVASLVLNAYGDHLSKLEKNQKDIKSTQQFSIKQRQSYQADHMFILCARTGITNAKKEAEVNQICTNYDTRADALKAEKNR
jgi:hypothetical protein